MSEVLTMGEPMGLLIAENPGPLKDVTYFSRAVCGAEVNFSIGLSRLGHSVSYVSCVGKDPFGEHIADFLQENGIDTRYLVFEITESAYIRNREEYSLQRCRDQRSRRFFDSGRV